MDDELKRLDRKTGISGRNKRFIAYTVMLAVFFIAVIILEAVGVISPTVRRIAIGTVVAVLVIFYIRARGRR